jgi:formylglycine-generating enzyme required for sulfatase activity
MPNEANSTGPDLGAAVRALAEGQKVFNRYTLIRVVGRSVASVVWLAWDEKEKRDTVLKFFPETTKDDASALAVFKMETRKTSELANAQIVKFYEIEQQDKLVAAATEFVEGSTLDELRAGKKNEVFSAGELTEWLQQIGPVFAHAHDEAQMAHGDLTPSNFIASKKGILKISDWGTARLVDEFIGKVTALDLKQRNLAFQSPQIGAGGAPTVLDDVYSLGATLYHLLTSKPPFYTGDIMLQVNEKVPPPMTTRRKDLRKIGEPIPRVWEETIASCLAKDPAYRPQSIQQVLEMLEIPPPGGEPVAQEVVEEAPASNMPIIVGGVAGIVVLALLGLVLGKSKPKPPPATGGQTTTIVQTQIVTAGLSAADKKKIEDANKAAKDARDAAEKAKKESDTQLKALRDQQKKAEEELKKQQASEKQRLDIEAKQRTALEAKTKQLEEEMKKAKAAPAVGASTEAQKKQQADLQAQMKALEDERKRIADAAEKQKQDDAKRKAELEKAKEDLEKAQKLAAASQKQFSEEAMKAEAKRKVIEDAARDEARKKAIADAEEKKKKDAEDAKIAAAAKAKKEEEAKKVAMLTEKAKEEAAKKKVEAESAKRFVAGKPVWEDSIGLRFVPVGSVYFSVWDTRADDFDEFVRATRFNAGTGWRSPGFKQGVGHPVVNVSWDDAQAFCKWLTEKEHKDNLIPATASYRLPMDVEWSLAAKLEGESGATPSDKDSRVKNSFPWGTAWPPPAGAGNYSDDVSVDRYAETSPVGSFPANPLGLYDMGGNVWQWTQDWFDGTQKTRVLRGGSYFGYFPGSLLSSYRRAVAPNERRNDIGFRVVLDPGK